MIGNWANWKKFPEAEHRELVDAPTDPGIYEVRYVSSGDLAAFDASSNVAYALSSLRPQARSWKRLFGGTNGSRQDGELEYRTCPAASLGEAKVMAQVLLSRRQIYWRRAYVLPRASSAA